MIVRSFYLPLKNSAGQREAHDTMGAICLSASDTEHMTVFSDHIEPLEIAIAERRFVSREERKRFDLAKRDTTLKRSRGGMYAELSGPNARMCNSGLSWYEAHPDLRRALPTTIGMHTALFVGQRMAMSYTARSGAPQLVICSSRRAFVRFVAKHQADFVSETPKIAQWTESMTALPQDGPDAFFVQGRVGLVIMEGLRMWHSQQVN